MRFCYSIFLFVSISCIVVNAQVTHIKPSRILDAPVMSYAEYKNLYEDIDSGKYTNEEIDRFEMSSVYEDLYSPACSWYCGGVGIVGFYVYTIFSCVNF